MAIPAERRDHPVAEGALLGSVAVFHVVDFRAVPEHWHVVSHLAAGLVAVGSAAALGADLDDLGLAPSTAGAGLRRGALVGTAMAAGIGVAAAVPRLEPFFDDPRVQLLTAPELARRATLDIPVGTAVYEELVFRSALLGLALRRWSPTRAVVATSALFGLWHVLPALEDRRRSEAVGGMPMLATVVPTVVGTTVAGAAFARGRLRSGSVMAPMVVHAATNVAGLLAAAWVVRRRRQRRGRDLTTPHVAAVLHEAEPDDGGPPVAEGPAT